MERAAEITQAQYDLLIGWIMGTCGVDWHTAKDLLQDVYVKILENGIDSQPESVLGYLYTAARNRHLDIVKADKRALARAAKASAHTPRYLVRPDEDPTASAVAVRALLLDAFDDLDALTRNERTAVVLRHYFGFSVEDIGAEMNATAKQVDNWLQQARQKFARNQAVRERSYNYAILALILRPIRDNATSVAGSVTAGFTTLAATVAFTVFTATTGVPATSPDLPSPVRRVAASVPSQRSHTTAAPGPLTSRGFVGVPLDESAAPALPPRRPTPATLTVPPVCTEGLCIGPGLGTGHPGDTVTVTVFGQPVSATEDVTPICEYVPAASTPAAAARCDRQEPDEWRVKDVPPAPSYGGPS